MRFSFKLDSDDCHRSPRTYNFEKMAIYFYFVTNNVNSGFGCCFILATCISILWKYWIQRLHNKMKYVVAVKLVKYLKGDGLKGARSRFSHLEKCTLNISSPSFVSLLSSLSFTL